MPRHLTMCIALFAGMSLSVTAQNPNMNYNKFKQLYEELPSPNSYRTASGAPGPEYWQQKADYNIKVRLDDATQQIYGEETITYTNNSPDPLNYLWLQLDQNVRAEDSDSYLVRTGTLPKEVPTSTFERFVDPFDGGFKLEYVKHNGTDLPHTIVKTMMRVDMPSTLMPGQSFSFDIKYWYNINDRMAIGGRSGYEYFEKDDNYLYTIAQFFPRMCVYNDVDGWQNKQFLGSGEFTLPFGDYHVEITVPEDHLVAATGTLTNAKKVLSADHYKKLEASKSAFEQPVIIATQAEAEEREQSKASKEKTWVFDATNVRDFAFASSRKFIWDAMAVKLSNGNTTMAMSMYPKEGNPLWEKYSTKVVAHTVKWYSHFTVDYPYPVAWSINAARIGMEYPMICFNYGRCAEDGTYSRRTKYGMIGVIIHEVGHNWFPMIINSDERQWTWMDEGLNTFVQYLTEQQFEPNYPSRRGPANKITNYMGGDKNNISPIMTNSESILQFGANAYAKPATALNILRETVMGRKVFDMAFKEYAQRWAFKHPTPADFFRTMEDASAVDLDWFWRGWFYTTDNTDMSITNVRYLRPNDKDPRGLAEETRSQKAEAPKNISDIRYAEQKEPTYAEIDTTLIDFYTNYDDTQFDEIDVDNYNRFQNSLTEEEKAFFEKDYHIYEVELENIGGLVMPVILKFDYTDGTDEVVRIPAEIWRKGQSSISKIFPLEKEVAKITLDPFLETADTDISNNFYPPQPTKSSRFDVYKRQSRTAENEMQRAQRAKALKRS